MNIEEIKKYDCDKFITVDSLMVTTVDGEQLASMKLVAGDPDLPIEIETVHMGGKIQIPARDIPQFIKALAMMFDESYF